MREVKDDGGPAFPLYIPEKSERWQNGGSHRAEQTIGGMTLRDWFAGKALPDAIAEYRSNREGDDGRGCVSMRDAVDCELIAGKAYFMADAMLKERAK